MKSRFKLLLMKFLYQHQRTFENEIEEKHDELFHYLEFLNGNCKEIADICDMCLFATFQISVNDSIRIKHCVFLQTRVEEDWISLIDPIL